MRRGKIAAIIFISLFIITCIDPYTPDLNNFSNLLVVDADVTDSDTSAYVKLSRTISRFDETPDAETGAIVSIIVSDGNEYVLSENRPGIYQSSPSLFRGEPGKAYTLSILTSRGEEYRSDAYTMLASAPVDTLYFLKDLKKSDDGTEVEGIRIFAGYPEEDAGTYYKWKSEECWKFEVPDPVKYIYIDDTTIIETDKAKPVCWAYRTSGDILIEQFVSAGAYRTPGNPVAFVPTALSDRFNIRYRFRIKQYSISAAEYEYLELLKKLKDSGGDIFERQPFPVSGNIHSVTNPAEQVLGFFSASQEREKNIYISPAEILQAELPLFRYDCARVIKGEDDYLQIGPGKFTFFEIHYAYTSSGYSFVEPLYNSQQKLQKLVFVPTRCADCTVTGKPGAPADWVE